MSWIVKRFNIEQIKAFVKNFLNFKSVEFYLGKTNNINFIKEIHKIYIRKKISYYILQDNAEL